MNLKPTGASSSCCLRSSLIINIASNTVYRSWDGMQSDVQETAARPRLCCGDIYAELRLLTAKRLYNDFPASSYKLQKHHVKMSINLFMSSNSVYNTTLSCDSLGIHYDVVKSSETGIITVTRWESGADTNHFVAEIRYPLTSPDMVRLRGQTEWVKRIDFLKRVEGHSLSLCVSFSSQAAS